MIVYKTAKAAVFVPCDVNKQPDLSKVPSEYRNQLCKLSWCLYPVVTSKDKEIFAEVSANGASVQKVIVRFSEQEGNCH